MRRNRKAKRRRNHLILKRCGRKHFCTATEAWLSTRDTLPFHGETLREALHEAAGRYILGCAEALASIGKTANFLHLAAYSLPHDVGREMTENFERLTGGTDEA